MHRAPLGEFVDLTVARMRDFQMFGYSLQHLQRAGRFLFRQ